MRRSYLRILSVTGGSILVGFYLAPGLFFVFVTVYTGLSQEAYLLAFPFAFVALVLFGWGAHSIVIKALPKFARPFNDAAGCARMGSRKDLRKENLLGVDRHGIYLGRFKSEPVFYRGEGHIVTVGPPRSGKGTALAVPNIWYSNRSLIVLDPKAELAAITYNFRCRKGPALVVSPHGVLTDTHPHLKSCGFNPFAVPSFAADLFSGCGSNAKALVPIDPAEREKFFPLGGRELLQCLQMMANLEDPGNASFADVNEMLRLPFSSDDSRARTIQKVMKVGAQSRNRELANLCNQFTEGSRTIDSIIASARIPLTNLNNSKLLADLDKHPKIDGRPFDFEMLKHRCITVYIVLPDDKLTEYNFWLRLIVGNALDALKRTVPGEINPLFLIDEAGNLGPLEALKESMSMGAGKGITIWTFWQSLGQLEQLYGHNGARTFLSDASIVNAFGGLDFHSAELFSKMMGNRTEVTARYNQPSDEIKKSSKSEEATGYALRRPEVIRGMKKGKLLTLVNTQPFELDAPGYFDLRMNGLDPNPYCRKARSLRRGQAYARA